MVFNYGPRGASGEHIDFNPGIGGGKFDPMQHLQIKFDENDPYSNLIEGGIEDKYDFYIEEDIGWILLIKTNCYIQLVKSIKNCDICAVSGGGGGGGEGIATQSDPSSGGGGGSGGQVKRISLVLRKNNYLIQIGQGGAGGLSEQQAGDAANMATLETTNGGNGTNTQLFLISSENPILESLGGDGGQGAQLDDHGWSNAMGGAWGYYRAGAGGGIGKESDGFSPGGNGATGSANSEAGTNGSYLFEESIFITNLTKDYFKVAGGGGGGLGSSKSTSGSQGDSGEGEYGRGGLGGGRIEDRTWNRNGQDGFSGLLAIRAKF